MIVYFSNVWLSVPSSKNSLIINLVIFSPEELAKEKSKLKTTQEEAKKLRNELQKVLAEGDGYRAAAVLAERSQKEELETLRTKYQEEIASLQHIMSGNIFLNALCTGFVRVLENLESPGILLWHFPGLESPGKRL